MRRIFTISVVMFFVCSSGGLSQSQFQQFITGVNSLSDSSAKSAVVDSFMNYSRLLGIPFIEGNTANYIYRGNVSSCEVTGDFDEFLPYFNMINLTGTNFFYYTDHYESNARLDYEFKINGNSVILDPENSDSLLGYYGYKSELAMPEYIQPWEIDYNPEIQHGTIIDTSIFSSAVNRTYQLRIYLPPGYASSSIEYPTVYFQDGFSYTDWGSALNVLDNLIHANLIQPIIAVFANPNNRNQEYAFLLRNQYQDFFVNELVPFIDDSYRTIRLASQRLVLGDSYGGNISALISYNYPDVFGLLGLHSAALDPNNYEAYDLFVDGPVENIKISIVWGSYDNRNYTLNLFKNALVSKGYEIDWFVLPEGHSWGLWRATVDTILQYFFPPKTTSINLDYFSADFNNEKVILNWQLTDGSKYSGFDIEKSFDRLDFKIIGFVPGASANLFFNKYSFVDSTNLTGTIYYRLKQKDYNGSFKYSTTVAVITNNTPYRFMLAQNYPNPFNPSTKIGYTIPTPPISSPLVKGRTEEGLVVLKVYDILGNEVAVLVNEIQSPGTYEVEFNPASSTKDLASGTYFYQLKVGELIQTKKLTLIK